MSDELTFLRWVWGKLNLTAGHGVDLDNLRKDYEAQTGSRVPNDYR